MVIHKINSSYSLEYFCGNSSAKVQETNPQTRLAKPTMIPEAKMAYPALSDSGAYICDVETLSSFVCRIIATITPYIATASQKITLRIHKK